MASRKLRIIGDEVLTKVCKSVKEITPRIKELVEDMFETMYDHGGVGLAAPQVGILKRIVVIDVGEDPLVLINPEILEIDGEQVGEEGCLSVPGKVGIVKRPYKIKIRAYDLDMKEQIIEGTELLSRAICHEIDHLNGKMYLEMLEGELMDLKDFIELEEAKERVK